MLEFLSFLLMGVVASFATGALISLCALVCWLAVKASGVWEWFLPVVALTGIGIIAGVMLWIIERARAAAP